jgi:putative N6-adenine-specific DNA methylase
MQNTTFFATTAKGLEEVLAEELRRLNVTGIRPGQGGVHFEGPQSAGYRACLWLRSANRVLTPLASFPCHSPEELYEQVKALNWEDRLTAEMTLAVDANLRSSQITHSRFAAQKTKDAIVDRIRERSGSRPNVDPKDPDLRINLHLAHDHATLSLDLAGNSLHRRGYRHDPTLAPLRETLAAGLVELTGYDGSSPFVDPMCGSGTMPMEAALIARKIAPNLNNREFGFLRWPDFDRRAWHDELESAEQAILEKQPAEIIGGDRDGRALNIARRNGEQLTAGSSIQWVYSDFADLEPPASSGTLICNPPYGERLGDSEALVALYRSIGDTLKQRWTGWTAWVFTGNLDLAKRIGLKPSRRIVLYNGPIECRLLKIELY